MGLLSIKGTIDPKQFWPDGASDADTCHVKLEGPFTFTDESTGITQETQAFENAIIIDEHEKDEPVIQRKTSGNYIKVRFQGIDAPELHFRSTKPKEIGWLPPWQYRLFQQYGSQRQYRQHLGETTTVNLKTLLQHEDGSPAPCTITTRVGTPNEAFDAYGRLIGTIMTTINNQDSNLNLHLVEQGLAFPTLYSSLSPQEIQDFRQAAQTARANEKLLWNYYRPAIGRLDLHLLYREENTHPQPDPDGDAREVIFPKMFRRLCLYTALYKARVVTKTFRQYLEDLKDSCFFIDDFLEQGSAAARVYQLSDFMNTYEEFDPWPEELIFQEMPSVLYDKTTRKVIDSW
jgi:endonuclease YncB( thermonuclease family)